MPFFLLALVAAFSGTLYAADTALEPSPPARLKPELPLILSDLRVLQAEQGKLDALHARLRAEFDRTERVVLAITGQQAILDNNPVIQQSIIERNPDTDLINALQVELLERWRRAGDADRPAIAGLVMLSVNALAAAMQSTG